jgi:hypothetical protein
MKYGLLEYDTGVIISIQQYSLLYCQVSDQGKNNEQRNVRKIITTWYVNNHTIHTDLNIPYITDCH